MRRPLAAVAALIIGAVPVLAACGDDEPREQAYCATADGKVVDPSYCDSGYSGSDALLYLYLVGAFGGHSYRPGQTISHTYITHVTRVDPRDPAARQRAGLPRTGTVKPGTTVRPTSSNRTGGSGSTARNTGGSSKPGGSVNRPQQQKPPAAPKPAGGRK